MRVREFLFNPLFWFCAPLSLALVCVIPIYLTKRRSLVAVLRLSSLGFVMVGILGTAFWSWYFKDGLGPGFIPSTGWTAFLRFWETFAVPLAISATEALGVIVLCRRRVSALRTSSPGLHAD